MSYSEDIVKLRKRMVEAVGVGFLTNEEKPTYETTLIQIMNEAERQRQNCLKRADSLKSQAATAEGQAAGFSMISSIIYNIVNSLVVQTERANQEEEEYIAAEKEAERAEQENVKKTRRATNKTK